MEIAAAHLLNQKCQIHYVRLVLASVSMTRAVSERLTGTDGAEPVRIGNPHRDRPAASVETELAAIWRMTTMAPYRPFPHGAMRATPLPSSVNQARRDRRRMA